MRSGKSNQHRIIRTLESGEKLRVLENGKKYSRVKTDKGETGWVLTRYLSGEPAARLVLPPVRAKLEKLEKENTELSSSLKTVTKERDSLKVAAASLERLEKKHKKLLEESVRLKDAASKSNNLSAESKDLARKNATLESQMDLMMRELRSLRDGSNRLWFLSGAGVILIGIVIGVIIARSRKEKKSSWGASTDSLMLR
jgi:SH3 domain protein